MFTILWSHDYHVVNVVGGDYPTPGSFRSRDITVASPLPAFTASPSHNVC